MEKVKLGPLNVHVFGGSDRKGGTEGPAILLCHGYGAPGDDLVSLARAVAADHNVRWFFPEAPLELDFGWGMSGRAWWDIDVARIQSLAMRGQISVLLKETPDGLIEARQYLEACVDAISLKYGVKPSQLVVGGFSQGAMLTTELYLHAKEVPFAGLAVLSGALISQDRWTLACQDRKNVFSVFQSHGRADVVLPFEAGMALKSLFDHYGASVDWHAHNGGHEIPYSVVADLGKFMRRQFS